MYVRIALFISLLECLDAEKVMTETNFKVYSVNNEEQSAKIPLMKHGIQLDILPPGTSMLGIIGGEATDITAHPYQLAIDNGKSFVCAGALLNRIWAISLASCSAGAMPQDLTVRVGSDSNVHGGTVINVTEIVVHPDFNYTTLDYDFALLKLNTYICYDNHSNYIPFCENKPLTKVWGTLSGWGDFKSSETDAGKLRQLEMRVTTHSACQNHYSVTKDTITDRMICASAGKKGPCYNDFGDPLVVNNTLYGLYSWSRGCADPNFPPVFSNLASVKYWIYSVMNDACICDSKHCPTNEGMTVEDCPTARGNPCMRPRPPTPFNNIAHWPPPWIHPKH